MQREDIGFGCWFVKLIPDIQDLEYCTQVHVVKAFAELRVHLLVQAFLPLFSQFDKNVIAAQLNPNVDPNVLKDQNTADVQKAVDPLNIVQSITAKLDNVPPFVFQQEAAPAPAP